MKKREMQINTSMWASGYCQSTLSFSDLKKVVQQSGLSLERSTIRCWVHQYLPQLEKRVTPHCQISHSFKYVDATYIQIKSFWHDLYRTVDKNRCTLDRLLSVKCNKKSAKKFYKNTVPQNKLIN